MARMPTCSQCPTHAIRRPQLRMQLPDIPWPSPSFVVVRSRTAPPVRRRWPRPRPWSAPTAAPTRRCCGACGA